MLLSSRHSFPSLALMIAAWVLNFPVGTHACTVACIIAVDYMNIFPCAPPYICPAANCLENYPTVGMEAASCGSTEEYCASNGVCTSISTTGFSGPSDAIIGQSAILTFTQGVEGTIAWTVATDSSFCEFSLNDNPCLCTVVQCLTLTNADGTPFVTFQADCSSLGEGFLDLCDDVNNGSPGEFLQYFSQPFTMCSAPEPSTAITPAVQQNPARSSSAPEPSTVTTPGVQQNPARSEALWPLVIGVPGLVLALYGIRLRAIHDTKHFYEQASGSYTNATELRVPPDHPMFVKIESLFFEVKTQFEIAERLNADTDNSGEWRNYLRPYVGVVWDALRAKIKAKGAENEIRRLL